LIIRECVFIGCSAGNIGAVFDCFGDGMASLVMSHLFFINSVGGKNLNTDVAFEFGDGKLDGILTPNNISWCRSQNSNSRDKLAWVQGNGDVTFTTLLDRSCLLPPFLSSPLLYVAASKKEGDGGYKSINRPYCGTESVRCETITFGDTTVDPEKDTIIDVADGDYKETEIKMYENRKKSIEGTSSSGTKIYTTPSPLSSSFFNLSSSNSTLIISKMTLFEKKRESENIYTYHLFSVTGMSSTLDLDDIIITHEDEDGGIIMEKEIILFSSSGTSSLRLNKVIIKDISLSSVSALRITDGTALISGCEFYNIIVINNVNGGVFYIETRKWKRIELLEGCKFEGCGVGGSDGSVGSGNGGGIYCKLYEGGIFVVGGGTTFKNCYAKSSTGGEGKGYVEIWNIYINVDEL
jgi:hypothetical protein